VRNANGFGWAAWFFFPSSVAGDVDSAEVSGFFFDSGAVAGVALADEEPLLAFSDGVP